MKKFKLLLIIPVLVCIFIFGALTASFFKTEISEKAEEIIAMAKGYVSEAKTAVSEEIEKFLTDERAFD